MKLFNRKSKTPSTKSVNQKALNFRNLVEQGLEKDYLVNLTQQESKYSALSFYKNIMQSYYSEGYIENLLQRPKEFFERGWFFPDKEWTSLSILWVTGDAGASYPYNNFLPESFWENPKLVKKFLICANTYWKLQSVNQANNTADWNDDIVTEGNSESFCMHYLGFKIQAIHLQLKTLENLQKRLTKLNMEREEKGDIGNILEEIKIVEAKISALTEVPLFTKTLEYSQSLYEHLLDYTNRDTRGLIVHNHHVDFDC